MVIGAPWVLLALFWAGATAAGAGMVGGAAFLLWVALPLARRLPDEQSRLLIARSVSWFRLATGLVVLSLLLQVGLYLLAQNPEIAWYPLTIWGVGILLLLAAMALAGPGLWRARLAGLAVLLHVLLCLLPEPGQGVSLVILCTTLAVAGLGFCLGSLPPLLCLLRASWPASVAQAVGARHFALILPGLALIGASLALAWPHREIFLEGRGLPTTALVAGLALLALLAAAMRGALLLLAGRPGRGAGWLAPLTVGVEVELIFGLLLAAMILPLGILPLPRHEDWLSESLMIFGYHTSAYVGGLLLLAALLAGWHAIGGPARTRYWPLLLLPLAGLLLWGIEGVLGGSITILVLFMALSELARLLLGAPPRLVLAPALLAVPALVLAVMALPAPFDARLDAIAIVGLIARWLQLRLPPSRATRLAGLIHALAIGAFGLLLLLPHVR